MNRHIYHSIRIIFFVLCFSLNGFCATPDNNTQFNPNLHVLLTHLLKNNEEIQTFRHRVDSAQALVKQHRALYYPTLDLYGDTGREKVEKEFEKDTNEFRHDLTLRGNQLITDFGKTTSIIERDEFLLMQAKARLESVTQQMMRDGIAAYINIVRARERLKTALFSEKRIKELTGIEKALVQKGAGLTSDVLQAKSQLAGAMALTVGARGELNIARNRFYTVFYHLPTPSEIEQFQEIKFPSTHLPKALDVAINEAMEKNPEIRITKFDINVTEKDIRISKSAYFPTLNLFAEASNANDDNGTLGYRREYSAGIEFRQNLYRGGSDAAAIRNAVANKSAATSHLEYAMKLVKEQVSNSWEQLFTLKEKNTLLDQQIDILRNFLELAKKERKMGTRSLLDVLNGEVNYINAQGNAISVREDTKIAAFNLLFAMGKINLDLFKVWTDADFLKNPNGNLTLSISGI